MLIPKMNEAHMDKTITTAMVTFLGLGPHKDLKDPNPLGNLWLFSADFRLVSGMATWMEPGSSGWLGLGADAAGILDKFTSVERLPDWAGLAQTVFPKKLNKIFDIPKYWYP